MYLNELWKVGCLKLSIQKIKFISLLASICLTTSCAQQEQGPIFEDFPTITEIQATGEPVKIYFNNIVFKYNTVEEEQEPATEEEVMELPIVEGSPNFSGDKDEFLEFMAPWAIKLWKEHEILPSITLAQAAVESAWGKCAIGWNLGGVKACCQNDELSEQFLYKFNGYDMVAGKCYWHGRYKANLMTTEFISGEYVRMTQWFDYYFSVQEFLDRRYAVLNQRNYYPDVVGQPDYIKACESLEMYASGHNYPQAIIDFIEFYSLTDYDPGGELYEKYS